VPVPTVDFADQSHELCDADYFLLPAFGNPASFSRGYGRAALTETEQVRRRLYCLHLMLIMTIETVYRGHTDTRQYFWARGQLTDVMALFGRVFG
jgi:hypothetical protein